MTQEKDFRFVEQLITAFFAKKHIQERLKLIKKKEVTGWEIWLQVEFAVFIDNHCDIGNWWREYPYSVDKRSEKYRQHMVIDFVFRKKNASTTRYIALEFKQNLNTTACIRGMLQDIGKVFNVKSSEDDIRSMWCLGIHPESTEVEDKILTQIKNSEWDIDFMTSRTIKNTGFSYTLF